MTDDLDRFACEITSAALRDDQEALKGNVQSLIVTIRQLRNELEQARQEQRVIVQDTVQGIATLSDALALARAELERERADATVLRQALITWIDADETNRFADEDENLAELARTLRDQPAQ